MIPIYRAKKVDSDEYVKGYLVRADDYDADADEDQVIYFIMDKMENYRTSEVWDFVQNSRIDPTTLAIHFPDMLDSQGNKIFASLQEDGKGGDMFILGDIRLKYIAMIHNNQLMAKQEGTYGSFIGQGYATVDKWKLIGIKE